MNDVLSMILTVMDHEADAYHCFASYMSTIQSDFMASGMLRKLVVLTELLRYLDGDLHRHFEEIEAGDLVFCHRWLLLSFKREVWATKEGGKRKKKGGGGQGLLRKGNLEMEKKGKKSLSFFFFLCSLRFSFVLYLFFSFFGFLLSFFLSVSLFLSLSLCSLNMPTPCGSLRPCAAIIWR